MSTASSPPASTAAGLRNNKYFLTGLVVLAPLTDWKVGPIQPVELLLLPALGLFILDFIRNNAKFTLHPILKPWLKWYALMMAGIAVVTLIAFFDVKFFPPADHLTFLKSAPWLSISRMIQLAAMIFGLLGSAQLCLRDPAALRSTIRLYVIVGVLLALYGIASYGLTAAGFVVKGASYEHIIRARGTFVEGGPFGLYLISVLAVTRLGKGLSVFSTRTYLAFIATAAFGLLLTVSKSAFLALFIMLFLEVFLGRISPRLRLTIIAALGVIFLLAVPKVIGGVDGYITAYQLAEIKMANLERQTGHFVQFNPYSTLGRVAAAYIIPNIVADRPFFGVGFGNYSLVRNDPDYRRFIPPTTDWDLPGLGLLSYAPEIGIPMLAFVALLLLRLPLLVLRAKLPGPLFFTALFPLTTHLLGTQITFFYPWLVSALAIAALHHTRRLAQVNSAMTEINTAFPPGAPFGGHGPEETSSIQVKAVLAALLRKWWVILMTGMICVAAAILLARGLGPAFTAEMTVTQQPDSSGGGGGGNGTRGGILAALSGEGGGSASSSFDQYLTMLKDPTIIARTRDNTRILSILYPGEWNPDTQSWNEPSGAVATLRKTLRSFVGVPTKIEPNDKQIAGRLDDMLETKLDRGTGYWHLLVTLKKKEDALELLNILHRQADELVREQTQKRALRRIDFINQKLADVRISEHQRILLDLLAVEERKVMLSTADETFAAMVISPPQSSNLPTQPKITRLILIGGALGGVLGAILAVFLDSRSRRRGKPAK